MQAIRKGGVNMDYNTTLFGEKRTIYHLNNNVYTRLFEIGSQNISVEHGFNSGAFTLNAELPADLALWEIGEESVLTRLTWHKKDSNNNRITHHSINNERVKMMLATNSARINTTTYDVNTAGSLYYETTQCNYRNIVSQSNFNPLQQYPLWNPLTGVTSTAPHFSVLPFIMDFDYSGALLCVWVRTTNNIDYTLKDFIDNHNGDTNIAAVYVVPYFGTATNHIIPTSTRFENGTSNINIAGAHLVNTKSYDLPTNLKPDLNIYINNFILGSKLSTQYNPTGSTAWTIMDYPTSASSYRASYYQDNSLWDESGLIPHGENNEYNQDDINYILKQIAFLGFWFTTDSTNINTRVTGENCTDTNTYLPEIKNGITTGKYWSGTTAAQQDAAKWADDWREKVNYQPGGGSDENRNRGDLTTVLNRGTIGGSVKWFALTETQLNDLIKWTNTGYQPQNNDQFVLDYKGTNPAEYITTIMYMPFVPKSTGTLRDIFIGPLNTSVQGTQLDYEYGITINLGFHKLEREYNDFRDYKPYTNISLYVPFCGTVELDAAKIYGMTINVKLMVDIATGSCTGLIFADDLLIDTVSGQLGVKIPLNVFNMSDYQDTIINAAYNLKSAERSKDAALIGTYAGAIVAGATSGTGIGLLAGAAGIALGQQKYNNATDTIENIKYNVQHTQPKQTQISTADAANLLGMERNARLIITRPYPIETNKSAYGHTMGFACNKQGVLSDFTGFTAVSACDTSGINATAKEKEKILTLLKSGVIIK